MKRQGWRFKSSPGTQKQLPGSSMAEQAAYQKKVGDDRMEVGNLR